MANDKASASIYLSLSLLDNYKNLSGELKRHIDDMQKEIDKNTLKLPTVDSKETKKSIEKTLQDINNQISKGSFKKLNIDGILSQMIDEVYNPNNSAIVRQTKANETLAGFQALKKLMGSKAQPIQDLNLQERLSKLSSVALERIFNYIRQMDSANNLKMDSTTASTIDMFIKQESDNIYERIIGNALSKSLGQNTHGSKGKVINNVKYSKRLSDTFDDLSAKIAESRMGIQNYDKERHSMDITKGRGDAESIYNYVALYTQRQTIAEEWNRKEQEYTNSLQEHKTLIENRQKILKTIQELDAEDENYTNNKNNLLQTVEGMDTDIANIEKRISLQEQMRKAYKSFGLDKVSTGSTEEALLFQALNPEKLKGKFNALGINKGDLENIQQAAIDYVHSLFAQIPKYIPEITKAELENQVNEYNRQINAPNGKELNREEELALNRERTLKANLDKMQNYANSLSSYTDKIQNAENVLQRQFAVAQAGGTSLDNRALKGLVGGGKVPEDSLEAYYQTLIKNREQLLKDIENIKNKAQEIELENPFGEGENAFNPDNLISLYDAQIKVIEEKRDNYLKINNELIEAQAKAKQQETTDAKTFNFNQEDLSQLLAKIDEVVQAFSAIQGTFNITEESFSPIIHSLETILDLVLKISSAEQNTVDFSYTTGIKEGAEEQTTQIITLKGLIESLNGLKIDTSSFDVLAEKLKDIKLNSEQISITPETFQPLIDGINKVISTLNIFIEKYESFNNILHTTIREGLFGESFSNNMDNMEELPKLDILRSSIDGNLSYYNNQLSQDITSLKNIVGLLSNPTINVESLELLVKKIDEVSSSLQAINTEWKDAFNSSDLINTFNKISNGLDVIINKLTILQESGGIKQVVSQIDFTSLQNSEDSKKIVQGTPIPTSEKIRNQIKDLLIEQAKEYMQSYIFDPKELALDPKKLGDFIRRTRGEAINKYGKLYDTPALITKAMSGAGFHSKDPKTEFHIESSKELVNDRINLALGQFARSDKGINILVEQLKEYQEALDNTITQRKELSKMIDSETTIKNMLPEDIKSKAEEISQALHNMYSEGKQGTKEYLAAQIELERLLKQSVINFGDGSSKKGMELLGAENIKDAETKLVEFWQSQGSAFDDFSMKFTDYYTNLYDTVNPNKLSNMQDMVVKGLGFMGSSGTSGFNLFEDITQKTEELKFVIDYINENYQQINEAAERLVQFGKLNTEQAQQQAQAEEQVANATERAAEAQTNVARENPDGSISNPNVDSNPQIKVEFDNDSVINVVEELGTLTDYINNQFSNLPPIRVNLNPDSMADINTQITALIQTFDGNRDIPIEVHLNYDNTSVERINEIINQINSQFNNVISIQIEVNPESLTNAQNQITDFVSNIVNYTHIPLEISLDYNAASVEHAYLVAETIVSELNQQFAQVEISPQITVDGSHIVINGNQPPVVPINTPAEPQIESPISPAVVNEVKDAEQQIRDEIQTTNEAVKYEWKLFNEPTGQLSFFENLAEESTEATNIVTENLNKIKSNMLDIEGQITLDDFREEQKRAQYEHTMTYNANDRLRYIENRVKATNNIDLSKYDGVNTNNLDSIRNSQKLIDQYYRLLQSKYNENGELLEPNKLQFALDLVKKIWTEIDNIRNLTEQIELPDSIENVLVQEHAEVLAQQEKERQQAISDLEKNYAKETRNNSYGFKDILNATKFDEKYQGISTQRLEDYRTSVDLLKEAKAEVEANFDASGKLVGNYEEAKKAIQNYKDALTEVKRIQEEITIEGKESQEANILSNKAYLEKTIGKQAAKGKLWDTDINKINNNYNSLKDNFTEEQITEFNGELEKINKLREQVTQGFDNKGSLIGNPDEISKTIDQYHQAYDAILSIIRLVKQNKAEGNTDTGISKEGKGVIGLFNKSNNKLTDLDTLFNKVGTGEKGGYVYTEEYAQALENAKLKADELKASLEQIDWTDDEQIQTAKQEVKDFEDQIKELNKLNKDMVAKNGAKLARNIAKYINDNPALSDEAKEKLQSYYDLIMNSSELGAGQLKEIGIAFTEIQAQEEAAGNTGQTFFSMLEGRAKSLLASLATFMSFYRVLGYIREGFGIIKEFDDALAEMQKVSNETLDTLKEFQTTTFDLADGIGTDALALQQSVAEFMRLGQSLQEATDSAKSANILLNVSEFTDVSEASEALIAMSQAYQDLSNMEIIDVINKLGNDFPISTQGLATALQDGAASLTTAGNSFYEAAALVTAGNRITQDPSKVGKAMRTIALRLTGTEASKAELEEDGEEVEGMITNVSKLRDVIMQATKVESNNFKGFDILKDNGAYKSTYEILLGIADIYEEIVENDEKYGTKGANLLLETIAGKNRASIAASILQSPQMLKDAYAEAIDAEGSAEIENAKFVDSISGHLEKLKNAWQEVWANTLNRDVINFFLDLGRAILKVVSSIGLIPSLLIAGGGIATLYEFAKNGGLIVQGLHALNDALTANTVIKEANTVATEQETKANIENVGSQAAETAADAADTAQTMAQAAATEANVAATRQETAENVKNAASQGVKEGSKKTSIGTNLATNFSLLKETASNAFTAIGGIKGILGGGLVIGGIVAAIQAYDALNVSATETAKEAKEISSAFEESLGTIQKHKDSVNELSETYQKLSSGVNTATNANLTLSNDEYSQYLDTCNKIADLYPQLVTGYDLQGNAIINLTNNVKDLQKALIEEQKAAANTFLQGGEKKGIGGFFDNLFGFFGLGNKNSVKDNFNKNYDKYNGIQTIRDQFLNKDNISLDDYTLFRTDLLGKSLDGDIEATNLLTTLDEISNGIVDSDEKLQVFLNNLKSINVSPEMQQSLKQAQQTILSELSLNDDYWNLIYSDNEKIKSFAPDLFTNAVNSLSPEKYSDIFSTKDGAKQYADNLVKGINSALSGSNADVFTDAITNINKFISGEGALADANMGDFVKIADSYKQAFIEAFADSEIDGAEVFNAMFNDKEVLGLTERFNQVLDNASFIQNDTQKQQALNYFNSLGQEEAKMYTESFKDATSFEDVDRKFGGFQRSLAAKAHEAIINIEDETAAINTLKSAISSSNGDTGLSSEEITNLETLFKDLMDEDGNPLYSAPELFENTANGIRLNQKQLKKLNNEYKREKIEEATDKLDYYQKALIETQNEIDKLRGVKEKEADLSTEERNRDNILQNIDALQREIAQYEGLTSAYNEYVNALSTANGNAGYDTIQSGYDTVKDLIDRGWGGADEVRQYVQMFSKEDVSTWSVDQLIERFNELDDAINDAGYSYKDFFTVDEDGKTTSDGVFNFLDALRQEAKDKAKDYNFSDAMIDQLVSVEKKYSDVTHQMEDFYSFDFDAIGGDQAVADLMNMDISTLHKWLEAAEAAGFDVVWTDYAHKVAKATDNIKKAKETLEEFKEVNAEDYKLNTSADTVENVNAELEKAQELIAKVQDNKDLSPEASTASLDYIQAQLDKLIQTKLQLEQPLLFDTNIGSVEGEYQGLFIALQKYGLELQTVQEYSKAGLPIDTSVADKRLKEVLDALKDVHEQTGEDFGLNFELEDEDLFEQLKEKFANAEISIPINQVMGDSFDYSKLPQGKDTIVRVKTILDDNGAVQGLQLIDSLGNVIDGSNYNANVNVQDNASGTVNDVQDSLEEVDGESATASVGVKDNTTKTINEINKQRNAFIQPAFTRWTINSNISSFANSFNNLKNDFVKPRTTTWTIKHVSQSSGTAVRPATGSGGGGFIAPQLYNGTAHALGTAYARGTSGNWGIPEDQDALVGELGEELVVRDGHFFTVGSESAEMAHLQKGDINKIVSVYSDIYVKII